MILEVVLHVIDQQLIEFQISLLTKVFYLHVMRLSTV
jgi:hypothetical protein